MASEHIGGSAVFTTSDSRGAKENLIRTKSTSMDLSSNDTIMRSGWLPKVGSEHNWVAIMLGTSGTIKKLTIDTRYLMQNAAKEVSVDALSLEGHVEDWELADFLDWDEILPKTSLQSAEPNVFHIAAEKPYTHVRLHTYGSGGVNHFGVYGEIHKNWDRLSEERQLDLILATNGGRILGFSSADLGSPEHLIVPRKSVSESDGWLTAPSENELGYHWVILKLAHKGFVEKIIVDTYNFWENRPENCAIDYCIADNDEDVVDQRVNWLELLPKKGLKPHRENPFLANTIPDHDPITHIRLKIYPFGGISRLRLIGSIKK